MNDIYALTDMFSVLFINGGHAAVVSSHNGEVRMGDGYKEVRVGEKATKGLEVVKKHTAVLSDPSAIDVGLLREALKHIEGQVTMYTFKPNGEEMGLLLTNSSRTVMIMPIKKGSLPVSRPVWIEAEDARYHVEIADGEDDDDE